MRTRLPLFAAWRHPFGPWRGFGRRGLIGHVGRGGHPGQRGLLGLCVLGLCPLLPAWAQTGPVPSSNPPPVASVPAVDLSRYVGTWYEIAHFPMFFQRQCVGDTTARYELTPSGEVRVINRCRTERGFDEAIGRATVVEGSANARLKVSFFWPFSADYWVLGLDPDYRWAVVGNPNRKYLWVLSRTPQLPQVQRDAALAAARAQGYDLTPLRDTPHGPLNTDPPVGPGATPP